MTLANQLTRLFEMGLTCFMSEQLSETDSSCSFVEAVTLQHVNEHLQCLWCHTEKLGLPTNWQPLVMLELAYVNPLREQSSSNTVFRNRIYPCEQRFKEPSPHLQQIDEENQHAQHASESSDLRPAPPPTLFD